MKNATLKRDNEFKRELGKFLRKWDTEIELEYEQGGGYHQDRVIVCYLDSIWENNECVIKDSKLQFGCCIEKSLGL